MTIEALKNSLCITEDNKITLLPAPNVHIDNFGNYMNELSEGGYTINEIYKSFGSKIQINGALDEIKLVMTLNGKNLKKLSQL